MGPPRVTPWYSRSYEGFYLAVGWNAAHKVRASNALLRLWVFAREGAGDANEGYGLGFVLLVFHLPQCSPSQGIAREMNLHLICTDPLRWHASCGC